MNTLTHKYFVYVAEVRDFIEVTKNESDRYRHKAEKAGHRVTEQRRRSKVTPDILNIELIVR